MNKQNNHQAQASSQNYLLSLKEIVASNWQRILDRRQNVNTRAGLVAKDFIQLVESYHRAQRSPKFYATKLNMTKSNLRKTCQQTIGVSPTKCIYARTMLEACMLLNDARPSVIEIASDLGFDDPVYFSRFFKKQSGIPPDAYRRIALKLRTYPKTSIESEKMDPERHFYG